MKPRIFISAVSSEFRSTRQTVANILPRLGYEPVVLEIFGTEAGDLRTMLREKIDSCQGLVQIVGDAYGFAPLTDDPDFGPVSYTQYEFLYAQQTDKKTWLIFAEPDCSRDTELEQLDLPDAAEHSDPIAEQKRRRELQQSYRERVKKSEHVWHSAADNARLELLIERLKYSHAELILEFRDWLNCVKETGQRIEAKTEQILESLENNPQKIRDQLQKTIDETYQRELLQANDLKEWRDRDEAKKQAETRRDKRYREMDAFLSSITATMEAGEASPEYLELTRILGDQGVDESLCYIESRKKDLLAFAQLEKADAEQKLRRLLAPVLEEAKLFHLKGNYSAAYVTCGQIYLTNPDWPEAVETGWLALTDEADRLFEKHGLGAALPLIKQGYQLALHYVIKYPTSSQARRNLSVSHDRLGDMSVKSGNLMDSRRNYEQGLEIARQLTEADPSSKVARNDLSVFYEKLGDVSIGEGILLDARHYYEQSLEIRRQLAEADLSSVQARRDLSVSCEKLGDVSVQEGNFADARRYYEQGLEITRQLAEEDLDSTQARRDLSISYEKLGVMSEEMKNHVDARRYYEQGLKIRRQLAETNPKSALVRRDLSVSYNCLGDVSMQAGNLMDSRHYYEQGLEIAQQLAEADSGSAQARRDLSISYEKLGDMSVRTGSLNDSRRYYEQSLELRRQLEKADPSSAQARRDLSASHTKIGLVAEKNSEWNIAMQSFQKALAIFEELHSKDRLAPVDQNYIILFQQKITEMQQKIDTKE
ncbi:tetratricopeptide repeat protein [uncultured Rubinisphaera sp.]|uniref:DUF4062 domain-containing protein n=1 Tax=uncultured Rubinisphaera sp. TaxID=1678686 RepID=UPI0026B74BB5